MGMGRYTQSTHGVQWLCCELNREMLYRKLGYDAGLVFNAIMKDPPEKLKMINSAQAALLFSTNSFVDTSYASVVVLVCNDSLVLIQDEHALLYAYGDLRDIMVSHSDVILVNLRFQVTTVELYFAEQPVRDRFVVELERRNANFTALSFTPR